MLNNSSASAQTIQLGGTFKKIQGTQNTSLNDGSSVTSVTIPAHDGIILLRTSSSSTTPLPSSSSGATQSTGNLALGKPATASSTRGSSYAAGMAVDGDPNTRWSAAWRDGEWWQVDLGATKKTASVTIDWEDAYAAHYLILTSLDGTTFTTAADVTGSGPGPRTTTFTTRDARYLRILALTRATQAGTSFYEVQVFAPPTSTTTTTTTTTATTPTTTTTTIPTASTTTTAATQSTSNLALGKPATASSTRGSSYGAGMAVDGDPNTRWSAAWRDGEWWQVDLGATKKTASVTIDWEDAYAAHYLILTSLDGTTFTTAADVTGSGPGPRTTTFTTRDARYLRILALTRATQAGTSFYEVQVFAPPTSTTTTTTTTTATTPTTTTTTIPTASTTTTAATQSTGNLALGKPATASSTRGSSYGAGMAVDGDPNTRWSAAWRDGEWWQVDLGATKKIASVTIDWEDAYAAHYLILTSLDGTTFTTAADVTGSGPGPRTTTFTTRDARYLRILALTRATQAGTSFYEVQVFGP